MLVMQILFVVLFEPCLGQLVGVGVGAKGAGPGGGIQVGFLGCFWLMCNQCHVLEG